jgi:diguanylate cyclase (GGDEF)-like protein
MPKESEILLVDDDPGSIHLLSRMLAGHGRLRFATSGEAALRMAREVAPDLMLLDAEMPGMSGFDVCRALKTDGALADTAVIFVTSHHAVDMEVAGLELGAADFIAKPVSEPLVVARVKTQLRIKRLTDELRRLSSVDSLTDALNRRGFDDLLEREWLRARRACSPIGLLMIDVDHFKRFNDRHGHPAGDAALRAVALALHSACLRPGDVVARFGGEEFVMLLPDTPRAGALHVARRVLDRMAALSLPHGDSPTGANVTVSIGVSCHDQESASWRQPTGKTACAIDPSCGLGAKRLIEAADKALYAAKRAGRSCAWLLDADEHDSASLAHQVAAATRMTTQLQRAEV